MVTSILAQNTIGDHRMLRNHDDHPEEIYIACSFEWCPCNLWHTHTYNLHVDICL